MGQSAALPASKQQEEKLATGGPAAPSQRSDSPSLPKSTPKKLGFGSETTHKVEQPDAKVHVQDNGFLRHEFIEIKHATYGHFGAAILIALLGFFYRKTIGKFISGVAKKILLFLSPLKNGLKVNFFCKVTNKRPVHADEILRNSIIAGCDFKNERMTSKEIADEFELTSSVLKSSTLHKYSFELGYFLENRPDSLVKGKIAGEIYKSHKGKRKPRVDYIYIISNTSHNMPFLVSEIETHLRYNASHKIYRKVFNEYDLVSGELEEITKSNFLIIQANVVNKDWLPALVSKISANSSNDIIGIYTIFDSMHCDRTIVTKPVKERVLIKLNLQ